MTTPNQTEPALRESTASAQPEPIEQSVYTLIVKVATRLEADLNRALRSMELTGATYAILRILNDAGTGGSSCGDISHQLIAEVPDMTRLLDRLERLAYISRERSSVDRRMVRVTLTESGKGALEAMREVVRDYYVKQLGHLGEEKLKELSALLKVVLNQPPRGETIRTQVEQGPKQAPH